MKWNMGWMHDTLKYMHEDPVHRRWHHHELTFSLLYAFNENFMLPLSHDEVVHGKGSLLGKMPGDEWQRFANLRLLLAYQMTSPGKKLLFMGSEIAQGHEWRDSEELPWHLLQFDRHAQVQEWMAALQRHPRDAIVHVRSLERQAVLLNAASANRLRSRPRPPAASSVK